MVPDRDEVPKLAATLAVIVPFPVPDAPETTVIQGTDGIAVHEHPAPALTETLADPPAAGIASVAGWIA